MNKEHFALRVFLLLITSFSSLVFCQELFCGPPDAVILQGFHWESHNYPWYQIIQDNAEVIREAGFDFVWFPPPTATADCQGYLPTQWYDLNSRYGSQSELTDAIRTLKKGNNHAHVSEDNPPRPVYAIVDIVVNHRCGQHNWADFAQPHFAASAETDSTAIEQANRYAVCQNDEWKNNNGSPAGSDDSGDSFVGGRDLDHSRQEVQDAISAWLCWMKNDIGFAGWRWDLVKGYHGKYVGLYNEHTQPAISIGEYWDQDRQTVINWVNRTMGLPDDSWGQPNRTGGKSTAFDFPMRKQLKDAVSSEHYAALKSIDGKPNGMIGWWPQVSVTFIENHDTEKANHNDPFPGDKIMQGYAYLLTHPGKPCVFWRHFFDWGRDNQQQIVELIHLRKEKGLHANSTVNIKVATDGLYAAIIDTKIAMKIGPKDWQPSGSEWRLATHGKNYAIWTR